MSRYWKVFLGVMAVIVVMNFWGVVMPLGVEGHPIQAIGFPWPFWTQVNTETRFRVVRLALDLGFAVFACHSIAKAAERQSGW